MSKLIRRKKEIGAALAVALQLTTLGLIGVIAHFTGGPQQAVKAPADSQMSAAPVIAPVQAAPVSDRSDVRASAVFANKVYGPRASQVFNLAASRAAAAQNVQHTQNTQSPESPDSATLTSDQEDYPPYSYVYFHGTGFQPGETVNMIVVELDPTQESFEPWDVVADENGEIYSSWYIFSTEFIGATLQATATGESSQLTASATFTDASGNGTMTVSPTSVSPGSTNNSFTFQFRAPNGVGNAYGAGSFATVMVPAGWTTPTTTSGQPGFVSASTFGAATVGAITVTGSGPWTITVPFTASGTANGFNLTYGVGAGAAVTAPCATGAYTFTTRTSQNGNPVAQVGSSPLVFDGITATLAAGAFGASAGNLGSVVSNTVTANAGQTLLILVTAEDDSNGATRSASVANTSGANPLSGGSAIAITTNAASSNSWVCSGNDCYFMYAFRATATGTSGTVTATFPTNVKNAAIDVIALSGNDTSNPIIQSGINSGNSSSPNWNLSGALTPGSSMLLFGDTTNFTATPPTWSTPPSTLFTPVDSFSEIDGARSHNLVNYFGGSSALSVSGSLSASARWGTIALEIRPATSPPPSCLPISPTTLVVAPASGTYGGTVSLSATLTKTSDSSPVSGKSISFTLNGNSVGSATTNGSGVATLSSVSLCGPPKINAGSYSSGVSANFAGDSSYLTSSDTDSLTVSTAALTITAVTNTKTYDGNTSAAATPTMSGLKCSDTVTGLSESYNNKNAGTGKTLSVNPGYTISDGNGGANYGPVTTNTAAGSISTLALTINAVADSKTYDGTTASSGTPTFVTLVGGDTGSAVQVFDSKNAGTRTLSVSSYTISDGNGGANYGPVTTNTAAGSISTLALTINAVADSKTYDGTTASSGTPAFVTLVGGDTGSAVQVFDSKNAGARTLSVTTYTINDGNSGANYGPVMTHTAAGTISTLALTINAVADSKIYNGTTASSGTPNFVTLVGGDTGSAVQVFDSKNAGARTLSVTTYTINDGNGGANYGPVTTHTATGMITTAILHIYATSDSKTYDGTTSSSAMPTYSPSPLYGTDTLTGLVQAFVSKNALGANGSTLHVTAYMVNDGNSGNNYTVATHTATGTISTLALTINAVADSKTYDGNATSSGTPTFVTLVGGDTGTAVQVFDSKNAGARTLSVTTYTISDGNGGANYGPVTTNTAAGSISTLALTINAVADSKTYDGTTASSGTPTFVTLVGGDTGSAVQVFDSKNAGTRTLSVSSYTISDGNGGANYGPVTTNTAAGSISTLALTINAVADSKTYDGTTASSGTPAFVTLVGGDTGSAVQVFDSKNAGARTLSVTMYTINDGNSGANYGPVMTHTAAGTISTLALTINAVADSKIYNGTTASSGTPNFVTLVGGDTGSAVQVFDSKNAGARTLSVTTYTINDGNGGANYGPVTTHTAAGTISTLALTINAVAHSKTYDGNATSSGTPNFVTLVGTDTGSAVQVFDSKNAGSRTLSVTTYTINDGNSGANYGPVTLHTAAGTISTLALTINAVADSKTYDGNATSSGTPAFVTLVGGDTGSAGQVFDSKNAGARTLSVTTYTINDGNSGANYGPVTTHTAAGAISTLAVTINAVADSKTYDGSAASSGSPSFVTLVGGDTGSAVQVFDSKNAGSRTLSVTSYTITDGNNGANYGPVTLHTAAGTISTLALTINAVADSKTYDGNATSSGTPAFVTLVGGDTGSAGQVFDSKNAGSRTLSVTSYTITDGNNGANYGPVTTNTATGTITAATLNIYATTDSKTYDGTTSSMATPTTNGLKTGDTVTGLTQAFVSKNVLGANGSTLHVTAYTVNDGNSGNNYSVMLHTAAGTISTLTLTINAVADSKTYNGNATSSGAPTFVMLVGGDTGSAVQVFDSKNAGSRTLSVTSYTITDGNSGANYGPVTLHTAAGSISTLALTINAVADSKTYDGYATSSGAPNFVTLVGGDTGSAVQVFDSKNAGSRTLSVSTYTISDGNSGANYAPVTTHTAAGSISQRSLTITAVTNTKTYDCDTTAAAMPTVSGLQGTDTVTGKLEAYATANAGTGKTLNVTSYMVNDGNGGNNYNVSTVSNNTGVINQANTTTSVTSNANPSTIGQNVTFTATVTPPTPCVPSGNVEFRDGAALLGTGTLNGLTPDRATFSTSSLSAGSHNITAHYVGDGNFNASTSSPAITQSVSYTFIGFLPPIDNLPVLNQVKAGQTIPVKWQLKDYAGNIICDLSSLAPNGLNSVRINCDSNEPIDDIEELAPPGGTVFRCDGTQFIYNWQTPKSWAGTCRQLQVTLADGHTYIANFKFK